MSQEMETVVRDYCVRCSDRLRAFHSINDLPTSKLYQGVNKYHRQETKFK